MLVKILLKHRPQVQLKSYCSEVIRCQCGHAIETYDNESWEEWAEHISEVLENYFYWELK